MPMTRHDETRHTHACAYACDCVTDSQSRPVAAFYLTVVDNSDRHVCVSPGESIGDVMNRLFPDGIPIDARLITAFTLPDID